jgi:hypothetical protein
MRDGGAQKLSSWVGGVIATDFLQRNFLLLGSTAHWRRAAFAASDRKAGPEAVPDGEV